VFLVFGSVSPNFSPRHNASVSLAHESATASGRAATGAVGATNRLKVGADLSLCQHFVGWTLALASCASRLVLMCQPSQVRLNFVGGFVHVRCYTERRARGFPSIGPLTTKQPSGDRSLAIEFVCRPYNVLTLNALPGAVRGAGVALLDA
jgi:hypothetical protein